MSTFVKLLIALSIACLAQTAIAEVVLLTDDNTTTLDLTGKEGAAVDLLECGIYVLEENGNTYLVYSKGRLSVPKLAMKRVMDDGKVEVDTTGKLLGLKLVSMLLPYSRESTKFSRPYKFIDSKSQGRGEGPIFEDGGMVFFVAESESKVAATLKKYLEQGLFQVKR